MKLSPSFDLDEFTISQEATRRDIDNTPPEFMLTRLSALCVNVLEPLRRALGPVVVTSGYRSPELNRAIGGSAVSQHMEGRAADIHVPGKSLDEVFNWILDNVNYDQVIREFPPGGWVHVSYDPERGRRESFVAVKRNGKTVYDPTGRLA